MLHNDFPGTRELEALAAVQGRTCVTIVTPTEGGPQDRDALRIAFGNQVNAALDRIPDKSERRTFAAELAESEDLEFWLYQSRSLVVYATTDRVLTYRLPNRLVATEVVADRFHLKPLLRATTFPQNAFVLALAENSVRLIEMSGDRPAEEIAVPDLPSSAADHAGMASITDRSESGRHTGSDLREIRVLQYVRAVDRALRAVLPDGGVPLILAAADPIGSTYRTVNSYPTLVDETLTGNPDALSAQEIGQRARPVLDRFYADEIARWRERFEQFRAQGRAATDIADVAKAATYGHVATMLVDMDAVVPGTVDPGTGEVSLDPAAGDGYGVVDEIARRALLTRADVLAVRREDMPDGADVAAILRFAP